MSKPNDSASGVGVLDRLGLTLSDLNGGDRDFLQALAENGELTTSELRSAAGLKREQVHYRYDKLDDLGLIDVNRVGENHNGCRPNTATLTDAGEKIAVSGVLERVQDPNANIEVLNARVGRLREDHNTLHSAIDRHRQKGKIRDDQLEELEQTLEEFGTRLEQVESDAKQARAAVKKIDDGGVSSGEFKRLESRVKTLEQSGGV